MRIAVIGTGRIGGALGRAWATAGHDVVYASRGPGRQSPLGAPTVAVAEAVAGADAVLIAVPGGAVADVVAANGAALAGTVVVDAANRIGADSFDSRAAVAQHAPDARY